MRISDWSSVVCSSDLPADAAGDEHRHLGGDLGQDLLREHAGRDRADMAAGLHALDHQRVDARADQLLGEAERGREADQLRAAHLDRLEAAARWQAAREHDRSEEHTSELQSLMRTSYAVFCLIKKKKQNN